MIYIKTAMSSGVSFASVSSFVLGIYNNIGMMLADITYTLTDISEYWSKTTVFHTYVYNVMIINLAFLIIIFFVILTNFFIDGPFQCI